MPVVGGAKNWASGNVLSAADLNRYVANQVIARFETIAERTAAYGTSPAPALETGLFSWVEETGKVYYYVTGTGWIEVGAQVEDGEITAAKLASDSVTTAKIVNLNVTTAKLADDAVTSAKIADGTIVNADISATAAIDLGKLADATILTKTSNHTLVLTDKNKFIEMNITSTANTVSVPTDASVDFPIGSQINITQYGTGKTQIVAVTPGTTSIRATPGTYLRDRYSSATLIKRAANEWYLIGDLSAS